MSMAQQLFGRCTMSDIRTAIEPDIWIKIAKGC